MPVHLFKLSESHRAARRIEKQSDNNYQKFSFRRRVDGINWRLLAGISVEKLIRDVDVRLLQEVLETITYCDIESEDMSLHPNYTKLFQLAQLTIEYLLFSQEYLVSKKAEGQTEDETETILKLQKENRQLKKTIYAYQLWSKTPGGLNTQPVASSYNRCQYCTKVFNSEYFLDGHLVRRHPDKPNYLKETTANKIAAVPAHNPLDTEVLDRITNTIERFSTRVLETERKLRDEMELKLMAEVERKEKNMAETHRQERDHYERELQDLRSMLTRQLEEEKDHLRREQQAHENYRQTMATKSSNIGKLEDDNEYKTKRMEEDIIQKISSKYENMLSQFREKKQNDENEALKKSQADKAKLEDKINELMKTIDEMKIKPAEKVTPVIEIPTKAPVVEIQERTARPKKKSIDMTSSFAKNPLIKSKYIHGVILLNGKRKEVEVALDTEAHRRNCTAVNLANNLSETLRITNLLRQERADFDKKNPFAPFIRQYILDQVADIVAKKFRLQPLKPPIPFKTDFSISTIKSPDKAAVFASMQQPSPLNKNFKSGTSIHSEVKWDNKTEASSEDEQSISDVSDPEELENNNSLLSPTSTMPSGTSSRPVSTLVSPLPKASESTPGTPISGESPSKQSNDNPSKLGTLSRAFNMFKRKPKDKESVDSNNALAPPVPQKLAMQEKETIVKSKLEDKGESPVPTPEPRKLQPKKNESEETKVQMITDEDDFDISDLSASLDHID